MERFDEKSLDRLYDSAVQAFPRTMKRQYATDPLKVVSLRWTPFVGLKTLFIKGLVESEGNMYDTVLLFKDVNYDVKRNSDNVIPLMASDGMTYHFGKISQYENDVLVRCNCMDYFWRFNRPNYLDGSHWGRCRKKYEATGNRPPANPMGKAGMCKHIMKTVKVLTVAGVFQ